MKFYRFIHQHPISEKKSIEAELLKSFNAKINSKTGKLSWELQLEPNEKKTLNSATRCLSSFISFLKSHKIAPVFEKQGK